MLGEEIRETPKWNYNTWGYPSGKEFCSKEASGILDPIGVGLIIVHF